MTDDESPHPGYVILSRRRDQGKAADHGALHHKVDLAKRRGWSLSLQDFEKISMVGLRRAGVALFNRVGNVFAYRTAPGSIGILPGQPVLLTRSADDPLGIL